MRCPKCNKWLPALVLFCPKCGKKIPDNLKKWGKFQFWIAILELIVFFATVGLMLYVLWSANMPDSTKKMMYTIIGGMVVLFALLFLVLLVFSIIDMVKYMIKHPIFAVVFCVVVLLAAGGGVWYFLTNKTDDTLPNAVALLQDNLVEIEASKMSGDLAMAKKKVDKIAMMQVKIISQMVAERVVDIKVPEMLADYKQAVIDRGSVVAAAAENTKTWKDLPVRARDFTLKISDNDAKRLFEASNKKLAELKEFGDTAILRNDKETMRYIAAKLLVQQHWLDGVLHSTSPDTASLAYAYDSRAGTRGVCIGTGGTSKDSKWCAQDAMNATYDIENSAVDFAKGGKEAKNSWDKSWENSPNILGTGITIGEQEKTVEHTPSVQAFYDACTGKGGIVGGAGTVKNGLPTTEFGYTCEYKYKSENYGEQPCWDYLTYSGGRYLGGNTGCPTQNVLPSVEDLAAEKAGADETKAPAGPNWNGTYPVSTTAKCVSNMPGLPSAIPVQTTVTVNGNTGNDEGYIFSINSNGSGTEVERLGINNENGSVNMIGIINYQFFMDKGVPKFNAVANLNGSALIKIKYEDGSPAGEQVYTFSCNATAGSTRQ